MNLGQVAKDIIAEFGSEPAFTDIADHVEEHCMPERDEERMSDSQVDFWHSRHDALVSKVDSIIVDLTEGKS
jgi:hypothetical protein